MRSSQTNSRASAAVRAEAEQDNVRATPGRYHKQQIAMRRGVKRQQQQQRPSKSNDGIRPNDSGVGKRADICGARSASKSMILAAAVCWAALLPLLSAASQIPAASPNFEAAFQGKCRADVMWVAPAPRCDCSTNDDSQCSTLSNWMTDSRVCPHYDDR